MKVDHALKKPYRKNMEANLKRIRWCYKSDE